jgi:hypothetical protein
VRRHGLLRESYFWVKLGRFTLASRGAALLSVHYAALFPVFLSVTPAAPRMLAAVIMVRFPSFLDSRTPHLIIL